MRTALLLLLICTCLLSACGQKGPLVQPPAAYAGAQGEQTRL